MSSGSINEAIVMTQDDRIAEILNADSLKGVGVDFLDLKWRHHNSWEREPSLWIWVILPDNLGEAATRFSTVEPLDWAIRDRLIAGGIELFPYISYITASEWSEVEVPV